LIMDRAVGERPLVAGGTVPETPSLQDRNTLLSLEIFHP